MTRRLIVGGVVFVLFALVLLLVGCGNESALGPQADVPLLATVRAGHGEVTSLTLATQENGDTLELKGATAAIERPDGTSDVVKLDVNDKHTLVTLGAAKLARAPAGSTADRRQEATQADVRLLTTVTAAPDELTRVTVQTVDPGDTLGIEGARAHIDRPDGTTESVSLGLSADGTVVTLGRATLAPDPGRGSYWNYNTLTIDGPVRVHDGPTNSTTEIGSLAFSFAVETDGTVLAPQTIACDVPTLGVASDRRVLIDGLPLETDYVFVTITDEYGGVTHSRVSYPDPSGHVVIPDPNARITADLLSGPKSRIEVSFGGAPKYPPPVVPGTGGGGGRPSIAISQHLNLLTIGGLLRVRDADGTATRLGTLAFGFEVTADGSVVAPESVRLSIPTSGAAKDPKIVARGLRSSDLAKSWIILANGNTVISRTHAADRSGQALIPDAESGVTGRALSGADSSLWLLFARTSGLL